MDYSKCTLVELRQMAKELGVSNVSTLKKDNLIELLQNIDKKEEVKTDKNVSGFQLTNEDDKIVEGILEILPDGYGFLRGDNYLSTPKDVYISPVQIRRFKLDNGDMIKGISRQPNDGEKFPALIYVGEVNGESPEKAAPRRAGRL